MKMCTRAQHVPKRQLRELKTAALGRIPYSNTSVNISHHIVRGTTGAPLLSSSVVSCLAFIFFGFSFFPPSLLNFQARLFLTLYIFVKPKVNRPVGSLDSFYG